MVTSKGASRKFKLLNREIREKSERIADAAEEIELSASAAFMDYYVDCMSFMEF